jgi:hypothetical protein
MTARCQRADPSSILGVRSHTDAWLSGMSSRLTSGRSLVRSQVRPLSFGRVAQRSERKVSTLGTSQVRILPRPPPGRTSRQMAPAAVSKTVGRVRAVGVRPSLLPLLGAVMYRRHRELLTPLSGFDSYRLHRSNLGQSPGRLLAQTPSCPGGDRSSILRRGAHSQLVQR